MDNTDWMIIHTLQKERNITATAEKLFITQPALTYRIKKIEKEFGANVFVRTTRGVFLTSYGSLIAQYSEDMLKRYNKIKDIIASMSETVTGSIHVAVSPAFARHELAPVLVKFREKYPLVDIYINTSLSTNAIELMMNDKVHVAIVRGNYNLNCETQLLSKEPITLIAKDEINLKELPKLPYIWYVTDINLEREISNWWRENYDVLPKTIMHINDSLACRKLVDSGLVFSILPAIESDDYKKNFKFFTIDLRNKEGKILTRPTLLVYKEPIKKVAAAKAFIDFVKQMFEKL